MTDWQDPEQQREYQRQWREANREHRIALHRQYRKDNQEAIRKSVRKYQLRRKFGLTLKQYDEMLIAQNHRCALCGLESWANRSGKYLAVDHDHETGVVRALLCDNCNTALGGFKDSPVLLRAAADYVEAFQQEWIAA